MTSDASGAARPFISVRQLQVLLLAGLIAAWEILPRAGLVPPVILAPFSATLEVGFTSFGVFAPALLTTLGEIAVGLVIAYVGGGSIGLILGSVRGLRLTLLPLLSSAYAIPFVVIYPILIAWIGIGPQSKIWFGGMYGLFPMALATAAGVQLVDERLLLAARSMGANRRQQILEVMIPATLPALVAGLRLGGALVIIGVVVAEMLASTGGIGFLITQYRTMFQTPQVYFGVLIVLVLAGGLDWLIGRLERWATPAHRTREAG